MITFIVVFVKGKKMIWAVNLLGSIYDYIFAYYMRYIVRPSIDIIPSTSAIQL